MKRVERAAPRRIESVASRGGRLEVLFWGAGTRPVAVAHHGFLDHAWTWDALVPHLTTVDVVSLSARGHGASDPADAYQWADFVLDLITVIEVVDHGQVDLIGHSWGAHVALDVSIVRPDLVRRLVNIDGVTPDHPEEIRPALLERVRRLADRPAPAGRRGFSSVEEAYQRRRQLTPRVPEPFVRSFVDHGTVWHDGRLRWALDPLLVSGMLPWDGRGSRPLDLAADLAATPAPVLLITGDADEPRHLSPDRTVAWEAAAAGMVTHVPVAGAGHYVHIEAPAVVADSINAFLR